MLHSSLVLSNRVPARRRHRRRPCTARQGKGSLAAKPASQPIALVPVLLPCRWQRLASSSSATWPKARDGRMPEKLDVAVLSITGVDVVLSTVPSFAHHVVGTHSRQGNTGRPHSEAALLESKLDGSWIANPEAFSCCCMLRPHSPALGPGPGFWQIRLGTPGALLRRQHSHRA